MSKGGQIFTGIVNSALTVGTCVLVAKETPKFNADLEALESNPEAKKFDKVKLFLKDYWPALVCGAGSVGTSVGSSIINAKTQANLIAAYTGAERLYKKYGNEVKTKLGIDTHHNILQGIAEKDNIPEDKNDGKKLFWNDHFGFIRCKKEDLLEGLNELKDGIIQNCDKCEYKWFYTVGMFLTMIKDCEYEPNLPDYQLGWCQDGIITLGNDEVNLKYSFTPAESKINGTKYEILEFNIEPYEPDTDGLPLEVTKNYPKEEE